MPTANRSQGARHALTFGILSVLMFLLPVFFPPTERSEPASRPVFSDSAPAATPLPENFVGPALPSPRPVAAQNFQSAAPVSESERLDPSTEIAHHLRRVFLSLIVTIVVIGITFKLFGKHLPGLMGQRKSSWMTVLGRETVGPTQSVALMRVGKRVLLVGISDHGMNTLSEFSAEEADEMLAPPPVPEGDAAPQPTPREIYGNILRQYLAIVPGMGGKKK